MKLNKLKNNTYHLYHWSYRWLLAKLRHSSYKIKWRGSFTSANTLLNIDVDSIEYKYIGFRDINTVGTHIRAGDWDTNVSPSDLLYPNTQVTSPQLLPITQWSYYTGCNKHFNQNIPWEETELHKYFKQRSENKAELEERLNEFEHVYERIRTEGYKTQRQLIKENKVDSFESKSLPGHDEVCVAIGRNGEIYQMAKGNHRMAISKILDLDTIPVRVLLRHKDWQKRRYEIYKNKSDYEINDGSHPDLLQLVG